MLSSLLSRVSAKIPLSAGIYYLYCQMWPHVLIKRVRFFQLSSLQRLNTLVIVLFQNTRITKARVSLLRQHAGENRVVGTQSHSRAQPNKHPLHFNLTRFTHFAAGCFAALLRCLQFIQRLQLNFPLPLISSPATSQGKEPIDSHSPFLSSSSSLTSWCKLTPLWRAGERDEGDMTGCNEEGEQREWWEMSMIRWEICLWKREDVCEGVGKQDGCERREMGRRDCVCVCVARCIRAGLDVMEGIVAILLPWQIFIKLSGQAYSYCGAVDADLSSFVELSGII